MSEQTILIVEDERPIREGLCDRLQREGFRVLTAETVAEGEESLTEQPDLVLLDRRLPDGDGLAVLRTIRMQGMTTPVIVLSARGEANDRIEGLENGADDYVTKPFHLRELIARVRAVLGRAQSDTTTPNPRPSFGNHTFDIGARVLRSGSREIPLSRLEFALLHYFINNPSRAIERTELLDRVWGYDQFPTTRTVDFHILALRRKIEPVPAQPRHLLTVHRVGYRFEPEPTEL